MGRNVPFCAKKDVGFLPGSEAYKAETAIFLQNSRHLPAWRKKCRCHMLSTAEDLPNKHDKLNLAVRVRFSKTRFQMRAGGLVAYTERISGVFQT